MKVRRIDFSPDEWLSGVLNLKADQRGCYITILMLIYSHGGPIVDDDRDLAHACNVTTRKWKFIRDFLLSKGKIFITEDGLIFNKRCRIELEKAINRTQKARENARNGGINSGVSRRNAKGDFNKNNNLVEADASFQNEANHQPSTINHQRKEDSKPLFDLGDDARFVDLWNEMATRCGLPRCQKLTNGRKVKLHARIKDAGIEGVAAAIRKIESNTWMHGKNDRGWKANPDFMLQESSFTKLIEGAYDRDGGAGGPGPSENDPYRGVEY